MSSDKRIIDVIAKYSQDEGKKIVNPRATVEAIPESREEIEGYVDEPCLEACLLLYDLNIQTYTSNGHISDPSNTKYIANIGINYDSLSEENKKVVEYLIKNGIIAPAEYNSNLKYHTISIEIPIHSDQLVSDVSNRLLEIAKNFQQQDVLYGRKTYEELKNEQFSKIGEDEYEDPLTSERISQEEANRRFKEYLKSGQIEYPYTLDGKLYFKSKDLLRKHYKYLDALDQISTKNKNSHQRK